MKICTIVGARPQFIKAAAVSRAIAELLLAYPVTLYSSRSAGWLRTLQGVESNILDIINMNGNKWIVPDLWNGHTAGRVVESIKQLTNKEDN